MQRYLHHLVSAGHMPLTQECQNSCLSSFCSSGFTQCLE